MVVTITKEIVARVGHHIKIELESNKTTGYEWEFVTTHCPHVKMSTPEYRATPTDTPLLGSGGKTVFKGKPTEPGTGTILFVYRQLCTKEPAQFLEVHLTVLPCDISTPPKVQKVVAATVGDTFKVKIPAHIGAVHEWEYAGDNSHVTVVKSGYRPAREVAPGIAGSGGSMVFKMKAVAPGLGAYLFVLKKTPWDKTYAGRYLVQFDIAPRVEIVE
ncbi:hypothetical protein GGF31_005106 [Allomyces arbusculus]|nr:hypothetical protein GGF31_005106 [Allomyces arbusculus]